MTSKRGNQMLMHYWAQIYQNWRWGKCEENNEKRMCIEYHLHLCNRHALRFGIFPGQQYPRSESTSESSQAGGQDIRAAHRLEGMGPVRWPDEARVQEVLRWFSKDRGEEKGRRIWREVQSKHRIQVSEMSMHSRKLDTCIRNHNIHWVKNTNRNRSVAL